MKVVINTCWGGFGVTNEVRALMAKKKGIELVWKAREAYSFTPETDKVVTEEVAISLDTNLGYAEIAGEEESPGNPKRFLPDWEIERDDKDLIEAIEEIGVEKASDSLSALSIVEIPDDINWGIHEYDGMESVEESHRSWS